MKMSELRFTLLSDGSSDRALVPLLTWLLREHGVERAIQAEWADLLRLPRKPHGLAERIIYSVDLYPCDLLFLHRDAERESLQTRRNEILRAIDQVAAEYTIPPAICVIPVRMQEAWLLFDEPAIRRAAGNPNGREQLNFPPIDRLEHLPDPKRVLSNLLRRASGRRGRRLRQMSISTCAQQVPEFIDSFAPLRALPAFNALEGELDLVVNNHEWNSTNH
jgi:hypothetical protein